MDSDSSSIKIEQLKQSKYYAWKIRIRHVLTFKILKKYITQDPPQRSDRNFAEYDAWEKKTLKHRLPLA